ncbi:hypothetical protein [Cytobacillus horneckiae]|uniref:phage baseplate protein n=1 Tax=Cytobacillus horneckiae TaxID=549687 RepID=UPI00203CD833|nr:hypothetical protein [Cytobacillus horneckiae]MCM3180864.1 hypothetical protein [Cytobacillus horneckiae]
MEKYYGVNIIEEDFIELVNEVTKSRIDKYGNIHGKLANRLDEESKEYSVLQSPVSYYTTINLPQGDIMQGFYFTKNAKFLFAVVAKKEEAGAEETYTLYRLSPTGNILDKMIMKNCGHGTVLAIEENKGEVYFWSDVPTGIKGKRLVRFKYKPNVIYYPSSSELEKYDNFGDTEVVYPVINDNYIILCRKTPSSWQAEKRFLVDVKSGKDEIISSIEIPVNLYWMQGITADSDYLYWLSGDTNGEKLPMLISRFRFSTGKMDVQLPLNYGEGTGGEAEGNYKEPEGLFLYQDERGAKSLFVGVVTGSYIDRNNKVFAYHSEENFVKFLGLKSQDIPRNPQLMQQKAITGPDGRWLFYVSAGNKIFDTLENFKGLATIYCEPGVLDSPSSDTSCRILANIQDVGIGNLINIDWKNRMWFTSIIKSNGALLPWQRVSTLGTSDTDWMNLQLLNGARLAWSYTPQYRQVNNRLQLKGSVIRGTSDIIGNLPVTHRPLRQVRLPVVGDGSLNTGRMTISTNGEIVINFNGLEAVWIDCEIDLNK